MSSASIVPATPEQIRAAAALVRAGRPVAVPTETVYGLAAAVTDAAGLERVFEAKGRPHSDPLIIHVSPALLRSTGRSDLLDALADLRLVDLKELSGRARSQVGRLLERCWPGPLTVVLPRGPGVPDLATAGLPTVALRMPQHPVAQALIDAVGAPLAAPSANRFGRVSPTCAADVAEELGDRIGLILDGGHTDIGLESTVLQAEADGALRLLRSGAITRTQIEAIAKVEVGEPHPREAPAGPGMLPSHYAPATPLHLLPAPITLLEAAVLRGILDTTDPTGSLALLVPAGPMESSASALARRTGREVVARALSPSGDAAQAAHNLFACIRALDHSGAVVLLAEPCPEASGLWEAIADRLWRAAAGSKPSGNPDSRR